MQIKTVRCRGKVPAFYAGEPASYLESLYKGSRIVQIEFQPRMVDAVSRRFMLRVVDLDPLNIGTRSCRVTIEWPEAAEDAVGWADVLLLTGSTLVKGTIGLFLEWETGRFLWNHRSRCGRPDARGAVLRLRVLKAGAAVAVRTGPLSVQTCGRA